MPNLVEFKVSKTIFDDVKNDTDFRIGVEAEFHVRFASDLLKDQNGELPRDFESFNQFSGGDVYQGAFSDYDQANNFDQDQLEYHKSTVLSRLCPILENHLGLPQGSIQMGTASHMTTGIESYRNWQLTIDDSLSKPGGAKNEDDDLGGELISPVMVLREGLAWVSKIFEMIETFRYEDIELYTSDLCGFHINLSHIRMGLDFDFAKLAILSGDEHYLQDFSRIKNEYAAPLMKTVHDELVKAVSPGAVAPPTEALRLLNLRGWNPQRVMSDMTQMIPMDHHMSVDLTRLASNNPYIEVRIAGNAGYERRYDEIVKLAIRFAALIKIACDPNNHREEYLRKIYQLVSTVVAPRAPAQAQASLLPRIRVFLNPVMSRVTRDCLDQIERAGAAQSIPNAAYLFLAIVRSAIDMRMNQNIRVRQGLMMQDFSQTKEVFMVLIHNFKTNILEHGKFQDNLHN